MQPCKSIFHSHNSNSQRKNIVSKQTKKNGKEIRFFLTVNIEKSEVSGKGKCWKKKLRE